MPSIRPDLIKLALGALVAAASPSASLADGYGLLHPLHHTTYVMRSSTVGTPVTVQGVATTGLVAGSPSILMPTATTMSTAAPSFLLHQVPAPMALMPSAVAAVPVHYLMPTNFAAPAAPTALFGKSAPASPLATASVPSGDDFRAEYAGFVHRDAMTSPAGVMISGDDYHALTTAHAPLAHSVGGFPRLVSLARFLKTKLDDPNFRAKAVDLIGYVAGTAFPEASPAINLFLEQLGFKPGVVPAPSPTINPANLVGSFEGKVGPDGTISGRFLPSTPPAPSPPPIPAPKPNPIPTPFPPAPVAVDPLATIESVARALGATIVSKDATGMVIKKLDGQSIKFGPDGIPLP